MNEPSADRPEGGPCCGAPAVPVASSKWAARHRSGFCFGDRLPCPRALASERLERRQRRAGGPVLAELVGQRNGLGELERLPFRVRRAVFRLDL